MYADDKGTTGTRDSAGLRALAIIAALIGGAYLWILGKHGLHTMPIGGTLGRDPVLYALAWVVVGLLALYGFGGGRKE